MELNSGDQRVYQSQPPGESKYLLHLIVVAIHLVICPIGLMILKDSPSPPRSVQLIKADAAPNSLLTLPTLNTSKLHLLNEVRPLIETRTNDTR